MSSRVLEVTFSNGQQWHVPLEVIAKSRAAYYTEPNTPEYDREWEYVMNDEYEGIEWAVNHMNWKDVEGHAALVVNPPEIDPDAEWRCLRTSLIIKTVYSYEGL